MKWRSVELNVTEWHRIFAFLPKRVGDEIVWLQHIERRAKGWDGMIGLFGVEYRLIP